MRENGFRAIGGLAQRLTFGIARKRGTSVARLRAEWPAIVGPELARVSLPEALIAGRSGRGGHKLLRLRVSGAAALEVQHSSALIVERVNGYFGHRQIDDVRLVQGVVPRPPKPRVLAAADPQLAADMARRVAGVRDPDLRTALARLGTRVGMSRRSAFAGALGAMFCARESGAQPPPPHRFLDLLPADHVMGRPDAPNILIDYFSMTCPHCASFNAAVLPVLKSEWIDAGRLKFVMRHFPSDSVATNAAQLSECRGPDKFFETVDALLRTQVDWLTAAEPEAEMIKVLADLGVAAPAATALLADGRHLDKIIDDVQSGQALGVTFTPTLFINDQNYGNPPGGADGIAAILRQVSR